MKKFIILSLLFIPWELNSQVALPTFQGVHAAGSLYSFSSHTFTNCGATGRNGPTLSNCTSAYSPSWTDNTNYFNVPSNAGIQYWTVPITGIFKIEVWGAQGGSYGSDYPGGKGAYMLGYFSLTEGEILKILVGQTATDLSSGYGATGGGGGSFVVSSNNTPLIIAGGGGGRRNTSPTGFKSNTHGTTSTSGQSASSQSGSGGSSGNGGSSGEPSGGGTGGPGGGLLTNGGPSGTKGGEGGYAFVNGGIGGATCSPFSNGTSTDGGFGAGGAGAWCYRGTPGGGGGYSGGATGINDSGAGGGGSYNSGSDQTNTTGVRTDHGQVIITLI